MIVQGHAWVVTKSKINIKMPHFWWNSIAMTASDNYLDVTLQVHKNSDTKRIKETRNCITFKSIDELVIMCSESTIMVSELTQQA